MRTLATSQPPTAIPRTKEAPSPASGIMEDFQDIWSRPLPEWQGGALARLSCRALAALGSRLMLRMSGHEHVAIANDPYILAANHSQKLEALTIPCLLAFYRRGRQVHFFADWNFLLYPGLGWLIRQNEPIVVVRKPATVPILNRLQPLFKTEESPMEIARKRLASGQSLGVFPEGTVNPSPNILLRGLKGAAQLSIETQVPVVPLGIRFPKGCASELAPFSLHFGAPMIPPGKETNPAGWHEQIMRQISILSGKEWLPNNPRTKHETRY